jgi:hypothetical protein
VLNANAYRKEVGLPEAPREAEQQERPLPDTHSEAADTPGGPPANPRERLPSVSQVLQRLDKNGDGRLGKDELGELPEQLRSPLETADKNADGMIDRSELAAAIAQLGAGARPEGPQEGGQPDVPRAADRPQSRNSGTTP